MAESAPANLSGLCRQIVRLKLARSRLLARPTENRATDRVINEATVEKKRKAKALEYICELNDA
jgi:hypothetical protein